MKKIVWYLLNAIGIGPWIQLAIRSELRDNGWYKSFIYKRPIDKNGQPIPWLNYAFLDFIQPRLKKTFVMFEYGSGNSTLWFSQYIQHIDSVEHDKDWYHQILSKLPLNSTLYFKSLETDDYEKCILFTAHYYDMVLIDGRKRLECAQASVQKLKKDGVIILDNSEHYPKIFDFLKSQGFKEITFSGLAPIVPLKTNTSIFYRTENVLEI